MVRQATGLRVLIVEDDPDNANSLALLLRLWGHDAHICHTGAEALTAAPDYAPHAVVLDIGLPGMSGWEVARRIREAGPLVLIGLSGFGMQQDFQRAQAEGLDHFLVKPADPETLQRLLDEITQRARPLPGRITLPPDLPEAAVVVHVTPVESRVEPCPHEPASPQG
jgi:CheY-like chemotaxis protein